MLLVLFWTIIFSLSTAGATVLLGDRSLISGNLFDFRNFINLILNWKFVVSMIFAVVSRFSFIFINNSLLKIPLLAGNSTTITSFITAIAFVFIAVANYYFLGERINLTQGAGAFLILIGIWIMLK